MWCSRYFVEICNNPKQVGKANLIENITPDDLKKAKNCIDDMLMAFNVQECGIIYCVLNNKNKKHKLEN